MLLLRYTGGSSECKAKGKRQKEKGDSGKAKGESIKPAPFNNTNRFFSPPKGRCRRKAKGQDDRGVRKHLKDIFLHLP